MEKPSSLNKIVGPENELVNEREKIENSFSKRFDAQFEKYEFPWTLEQQELINDVITYCNNFLREKYNVQPLPIEIKHIHFIDFSKLPPETQKRLSEDSFNGEFSLNYQRINILKRPDRTLDNLKLAEIVAHEIFHFNSFQSITITPESIKKEEFLNRRSGLTIKSKPKITIKSKSKKSLFFQKANEAITQELTVRFLQSYGSQLPNLEKDYEETREGLRKVYEKKKKENPKKLIRYKEEITQIEYGDETSSIIITPNAAYLEARKSLKVSISQIAAKNPDRFNNSEEVFQFLVDCYFNGKLLEFGRILEKTYGKGAFTKAAEMTKKE